MITRWSVDTVREGARLLRRRLIGMMGGRSVPFARRRATPIRAMSTFVGRREPAVILDVGGNVGQSIQEFRRAFPRATIHSFEPSPTIFGDRLLPRYRNAAGIHLWNVAVGAAEGRLALRENSASTMSSFLAPGRQSWGDVVRLTEVPVITLDAFASDQGIDFIHILKSDTQGFDLEVFNGSERLLREGRIGMILVEITVARLYEGLPTLDVMYRHLVDRHFELAGLYKIRLHEGLFGWMDALFVNRDFHRARHRSGKTVVERLT